MNRTSRSVWFYLIVLAFAFERCAYNDVTPPVNCDESTLSINVVSKTDVSNCKAIDGAVTVSASGGSEPYDFRINEGEYQTNTTFSNLGPGIYTLRVKDKSNCWRETSVTIAAANSTLFATVALTADNQCATDNGTATITATGGTAPYEYQIDSKGFGNTNAFTELKEGQHILVVRDAEGCQFPVSVTIQHGNTGTSFNSQIKPLLTTYCTSNSNCHGAGSGGRDWTNFDNVKANAAVIKSRTADRSMPPNKTMAASEIQLITCWVDDGALEN